MNPNGIQRHHQLVRTRHRPKTLQLHRSFYAHIKRSVYLHTTNLPEIWTIEPTETMVHATLAVNEPKQGDLLQYRDTYIVLRHHFYFRRALHKITERHMKPSLASHH